LVSASRRVRLCLAEKGLAFDSKLIDLTKMEHHSPAFLKLNPNGVIPLLILEDGRSLYESGTICEYLDETHPEPPLRSADPFERAVMRNWIRHIDGLIGNLIVFNWAHSMAKIASQWSDAELAEKLAKVPSKERREAWLRTARQPYTEEERGRRAPSSRWDCSTAWRRRCARARGWLAGGAIRWPTSARRALRQAHRRRSRRRR
jgi:glutathione S-transferase